MYDTLWPQLNTFEITDYYVEAKISSAVDDSTTEYLDGQETKNLLCICTTSAHQAFNNTYK